MIDLIALFLAGFFNRLTETSTALKDYTRFTSDWWLSYHRPPGLKYKWRFWSDSYHFFKVVQAFIFVVYAVVSDYPQWFYNFFQADLFLNLMLYWFLGWGSGQYFGKWLILKDRSLLGALKI